MVRKTIRFKTKPIRFKSAEQIDIDSIQRYSDEIAKDFEAEGRDLERQAFNAYSHIYPRRLPTRRKNVKKR